MPGKHAAKTRQHGDEKDLDGPMSTHIACDVREADRMDSTIPATGNETPM